MNTVERIKSICKERKIPVSRLEKDLNFGNAYIAGLKKGTVPDDRLRLISKYLDVSVEYLMTGEETEREEKSLTPRDEKDIRAILSNTEELLRQPGLMFDGNPASQEAIDSILSAMQIGMEMAKKKNKELYTPKKYKKEQ